MNRCLALPELPIMRAFTVRSWPFPAAELKFLFAALLTLTGAPTSAQNEPELGSPADDALIAFSDGLAAAYISEKNLPGLAISVTGPQDVRVLRGYGFADVDNARPVDPESTVFRLASVTKTFIWTAVMMQVDAGRLDLDADINDYLEEIEIHDTFEPPVTMRHLMTHTAGFEESINVYVADDNDTRSLAEALSMTQPARVFPPGSRTSYSNWGAALAARVVERLADKPYQRVVEEDLLRPLGMDDTHYVLAHSALEPPLSQRMATGYEYTDGRHQPTSPSELGAFAPVGAIASTAADMTRYMRFHLNGGEFNGVRLLSREAHAVLWQRAFGEPSTATGVSHGFQVKMNHNLTVIGHGGTMAGYLADMMLAPELGIGVFVAQNSGQGGGRPAVQSITQRIIERAAAVQGVALNSGNNQGLKNVAEYVGAYIINRRPFTTTARVYWLPVTLSVASTADGGLLVRSSKGAYRYLPVAGAPDVFENARGTRIRFLRDADGRVAAVQDSSGVHTHDRVTGVDAPRTLAMVAGVALLLTITTLLGFWRRWKHTPELTTAGRRAASVALIGACMVLLYFALGAAAISEVASFGAADYHKLPPPLWKVFVLAGYGLAAIGALALWGLWPAWSGSMWNLFRKLHYTAFAAVLAGLALMLWYWNFYGAPYI